MKRYNKFKSIKALIIFVVLVSILVGCTTSNNEESENKLFSDKGLEKNIRKALDKPTGEIIKDDLKGIIILEATYYVFGK